MGVVGAQGLLAKCSTNFPLLSFASVFQDQNVESRAALGRKLETEYQRVTETVLLKSRRNATDALPIPGQIVGKSLI